MRILQMITPSKIGGAETQVVTITRELTELGDDVLVFCPAQRPFASYLARNGITPISWRTWGKFDIPSIFRIARVIRSHGIEILHTHLSTASLHGSLAARMTGIPCVATVHGYNSMRCYRYADHLIAVSEDIRAHILRQGISPERVSVIYNGIRLQNFQPIPVAEAKRALGFDPAVPRVGAFRRLAPEKGLPFALRAWAKVIQEFPTARLMVVGQGRLEGELRALAQELGLEERVEFPGFQANPVPLMAACDVIIVPSLIEPFGLAAIEGMAMERPVVVSDAGGLAEIVSDGENGLIVPRGQPEPLADAIRRLLRDPRLAARLARAGRALVERRFRSESQILAIRELLLSRLPPETRVDRKKRTAIRS